ncbi:uncharacterized protein Dwil_GK11387 [Drosophila willistoni]|uniref:Telomere-binding protein cav n=1 Tax=Drosophila willistoni TaxID=7260 RepID=B4NAG3_DROWI|nr:uncharacterized protein Dwil_GK11387 [Drosophila willistoni]
MSLLLNLETLRLHQEEEKRSMLSGASKNNQDLMLDIFERSKVTIEDLKRQYTSDEVKALCLRTKLQVNMTHLNCVYDAKKRLDAKGRLANRSNRFIDKMLAKAVNRRMVSPYSDDDVAKYKYLNLCEFKKDNNIRLDCWKKRKMDKSLDLREDQDERRSLPTPENEAVLNNLEEASAIEAFSVDGIGDDIEEDEADQGNTNEISNVSVPSTQIVAQPDWLREIDEINSESMTFCSNELLQTQSQSQTQSEGLGADMPSTAILLISMLLRVI